MLDFPSYFENNANQGFALGPALKAGHKMISNIGGKLVCFAATLPNIGEGKLSVRDEASVAGKAKEAKALLTPADSFTSHLPSHAILHRLQLICFDLFGIPGCCHFVKLGKIYCRANPFLPSMD